MLNKKDLRIQRTKMMIENALFELLNEGENIDSVTVQRISEKALINRSTFYLHYYDKYHLLEKMTDETINSFKKAIAPCEHVKNKTVEISRLQESLQKIFEEVKEKGDIYRVFLKEEYNSFRKKIEESIREKFAVELEALNITKEKLSVPREILIHYLASSLTGLIIWWLDSGLKLSPKQMAQELFLLFTLGPAEIVQVNILSS